MITTLFARSLENPKTNLSDPAAWLFDALGATASASGMRVNHRSALSYSAVWRGVNLIARDVGRVPLDLFRRAGEGKEKAREHPAYRLVRWQANPELKATDWKVITMGHALLWGNGYSQVRRNGRGDVAELIPIAPDAVTPVRLNGVLQYVVDFRDGDGMVIEQRRVMPRDILHIRGLGADDLQGYDVVTFARETIALGQSAQRFASMFFGQGANPGMVLTHPATLKEAAVKRLRESFQSMQQGLDRAWRPMILEEGMTVTPLTIPPGDAQFMELREHELREIANYLGVPPHKLGDTSKTSFSSLEQENSSYLQEALDPWFCQFEDECRAKLLTPEQQRQDTHVFEFNREVIVRVDFEAKIEGMVKQVNNGLLSPDEARSKLNLAPVPGGLGARFRMPANIVFIDTEPSEPEPPEPGPDEPADPGEPGPEPDDEDDDSSDAERQAAFRALLVESLVRMNRRIGLRAERAARKPGEYLGLVQDALDKNNSMFELIVGKVCRAIAAATGRDGEQMLAIMTTDYFSQAEELLAAAADCQPAELEQRVSDAVDDLVDLSDDIISEALTCSMNGEITTAA